jgi:hypothetical protein
MAAPVTDSATAAQAAIHPATATVGRILSIDVSAGLLIGGFRLAGTREVCAGAYVAGT